MFWEIPSQGRSGHILVTGAPLGAAHAALQEVIQDVEQSKGVRSMFAETRREREEILEAIRSSEWNMEMNPLSTAVECPDRIEHDFSVGYV